MATTASPTNRVLPAPANAVATGAAVSVRSRRRTVWLARLESPLAPYYLILGATVALLLLGLVMVLSSSSVVSYIETKSSYSVFAKQARFAAIGIPLAWVASRVPIRVWQRLSWLLLSVGAIGLVLVAKSGRTVGGNKNWIQVSGMTLQPSEAVKLALVIWAATVLARKRALLGVISHALIPVIPVSLVLLGLVMVGNDLGTALIIVALVAAVLFTAGAPLRIFALLGAVAVPTITLLVFSSPSRMKRFNFWGGGGAAQDYHGTAWQPTHGAWALASGGWWGVGLGASHEKWSWLPEAHNDFIFAIIGEELGLVGTLAVLALFALLAVGLFRLVTTTDDLFVKIATGGVFTWIMVQAIVNIGAVLGLLPVVGVPLPLLSSGGSALVTTLIGLGMVIGFARQAPGAAAALASRPGVVRRSLAVLPGALPRHQSRIPARMPGTTSGTPANSWTARPRRRGGGR